MKCPMCDVPLTLSERHGVEIDYCPGCRGVWLDRGELDKILERVAAIQPAERSGSPAAERGRDAGGRWNDDEHDNDRRYASSGHTPTHRKRGFLAQLFDFD
ncbi:MAG: zf-TFIIB domain-containing protein [Armatimonadetes bacterium]|nr:zf-TFIIB domain-containing protein [Armatimonadota bacterium]